MADERRDEWVDRLRDGYHRPGETPREEMWAGIQAHLSPRDAKVLPLEDRRNLRSRGARVLPWATAAAALVVLGVGIGRVTAPDALENAPVPVEGTVWRAPGVGATPLRVAAMRHLGRSEGLLTLVQADGRSGRMDPQVGPWARALLGETRLFLDRTAPTDPDMTDLLEDLELVLVQIVGASEVGAADAERASAEISLTLLAIQQRDVVPRIQALTPDGPAHAGA
jgi:hypothetical protein